MRMMKTSRSPPGLRWATWGLLALLSCDWSLSNKDLDGDGISVAEGDCDDEASSVGPEVAEACGDGIDNDCDEEIDEKVEMYADCDEDGSGNPDCATMACNELDLVVCDESGEHKCNLVRNDDDCDDTRVGEFSGTWFVDADDDGHGNSDNRIDACDQPAGTAEESDDCDDEDPTVWDPQDWYEDADGDDFGNAGSTTKSCHQPDGWVANDDDCDDDDPTITVAVTWYADVDGDTWGDASAATDACEAPSEGHVTTSGDCDDADPTEYPTAEETCLDDQDNDCDATTAPASYSACCAAEVVTCECGYLSQCDAGESARTDDAYVCEPETFSICTGYTSSVAAARDMVERLTSCDAYGCSDTIPDEELDEILVSVEAYPDCWEDSIDNMCNEEEGLVGLFDDQCTSMAELCQPLEDGACEEGTSLRSGCYWVMREIANQCNAGVTIADNDGDGIIETDDDLNPEVYTCVPFSDERPSVLGLVVALGLALASTSRVGAGRQP